MGTPKARSISASAYDLEYYLANCGGFDEFQRSQGRELPGPMQVSFQAANVQPGERVLDLGCGRGEFIFQAGCKGAMAVGVDYSPAALRLARSVISSAPAEGRARLSLTQANAQILPFASGSFDVVVWLDVIEHLTPLEVHAALREIVRLLRLGGRLILHTMPDLWYYKYGYYIWRWLAPTARRTWPLTSTEAFAEARHINEQSPLMLWRLLRDHGLRPARVWHQTDITTQYTLSRIAHFVLLKVPPFRWLCAKDLYAVAIRVA